jgi:peptidoglycan/LPS O-acetylase OafA/YrhL
MEQTNVRFPVPRTGTVLARRTAAGVGVAIVGLLVVQAIVDALNVELGASGPMTPFAAPPLIGTTIVAGVGAAIAYAAMVKFTNRPVRNFVAVAVIVFAVMLVPVLLVTPSMGITPAGKGLLVLYHLLVAVPLVGFIIGAVDL